MSGSKRRVELTEEQLRLVLAAVDYRLEQDEDGDGYPSGGPQERTLKRARAALAGSVLTGPDRRLHTARTHILSLAQAVEADVDASDLDHPIIRDHANRAKRARAFLERTT